MHKNVATILVDFIKSFIKNPFLARRIMVEGQSGRKLAKPHHKRKLGVVVIPVVPATQEAEVGGSRFEVNLGKVSMRLYLKNKLKAKRLMMWFKW
jgi:hypothetical protein